MIYGFDKNGNPISESDDFLQRCRKQNIPCSKGMHTYLEAMQEAFPDESKSEINRWFRDEAVRVFGYVCAPEENPDELYGGKFVFAVFTVGKRRGFLFR